MEIKTNALSTRQKIGRWLNDSTSASVLCILLILAFIVSLPGLGVVFAFLIVGVLLWLQAKEGIVGKIGFRRPESWLKTILLGLIFGVFIEISFQVLVNPFLESITKSELDLGFFDDSKGNTPSFLFNLVLGWVVGGFLEEMTFRGYLITQIKKLLGGQRASVFAALLITSAAFGSSHLYQGASGILSTGLIGFILGIMYIKNRYNLWLPIFTHGFINTIGFGVIYLDLDSRLRGLLW